MYTFKVIKTEELVIARYIENPKQNKNCKNPEGFANRSPIFMTNFNFVFKT